MIELSVIIPAYNEAEYLPATLERLRIALRNVTSVSEIVVVDNGSTDNTREVAASFGALVISETEHNISRVRNTGAANSHGNILVFIDADTFVPPTLFQKILAKMEDPNCFGGAVAVEYEALQSRWIKIYLLLWKLVAVIFNLGQGAAQFCRKSVFDEVGGYDETIFVGEDVEFYWRLKKFTKQRRGFLQFVNEPKVTTSSRRFNKMGVAKTLLLTHPIFIWLAWRKQSFWKDWYERTIR